MIRFFEYITLQSNSLESKYKPLEEPVDLGTAQYLIRYTQLLNVVGIEGHIEKRESF